MLYRAETKGLPGTGTGRAGNDGEALPAAAAGFEMCRSYRRLVDYLLNRSVTENAKVLPPTPSGGAG